MWERQKPKWEKRPSHPPVDTPSPPIPKQVEASQPLSTGPGVDAQRRSLLHTQGLALPWEQRGCQGDRLPRARHPSQQWRPGVGRVTGGAQLRACTCDHATTIWGPLGQRAGSCLLGTTENTVSMPTGYVHLTFSSALAWGQEVQLRTLSALSLPAQQPLSLCPA